MHYRQIIDHCFEERLGEHGIGNKRAETLLAASSLALEAVKSRKNFSATPLLALPFRTHDLTELETIAAQIRERYKHVVVVGSGGSTMSGRMLSCMKPSSTKPYMHFLDSIDPDAIADVMQGRDMNNTFFIVISKSGGTVETLSQFYVLLNHVRNKLGGSYVAERFLVIAGSGDNPLRKSAAEYRIRTLDHDVDIGGRFSVLTNVGLLPAAIAGINIRALREGAQSVVRELDIAATPRQCQPALGAVIQYAFIEKGRNLSVMFPYAEKLSGFSAWYRQCWAESLGKSGKGSTPIPASGTPDQHSQLQLYLDGPKDKFFNIITVKRANTGQRLLEPMPETLAYMQGKTTGDIMAAQQKATIESMTRNRCPVRLFELDVLKEEQLGALVMHFTLEIIFISYLLNVNPFDQPAVEESKRLAREYLQKGDL